MTHSQRACSRRSRWASDDDDIVALAGFQDSGERACDHDTSFARCVLHIQNALGELDILPFNKIRDARARIQHDAFSGAVPDPLHLLHKRLGLAGVIKLQVIIT
jgi:hypothetical protein